MKIKKNDTILVIAGKDKGKKGKVLKVFPELSKIMVEGMNLVKKHRKPRKQNEKGQVIEIPKPFSVANVKLICQRCNQAARVGYKITDAGKIRICKKCGQEV
ncbi:MAG: 50S ribosomal protein L24 [Candidatus Portnoybacteria bacterium]|nr:50S ribosomal protein L24 [Candidatus Portnoybacteria bacterium]